MNPSVLVSQTDHVPYQENHPMRFSSDQIKAIFAMGGQEGIRFLRNEGLLEGGASSEDVAFVMEQLADYVRKDAISVVTNGRRIEAGKKSGFSQDATVVSIDSNNTVEVVKPGQRSAWTTRAYTCSGAGNLPVQPVQSRSNSAFPAAVKVTAIGREQDSPSTSGRAVKGMALGLGPDSPGAPGRGRVDSVIVSLGPVAVAIARDAMNGQYDEVGSGVGVGSSGSVL